jgi:Ca2+-transporting ATPase
MNDWYKKNADQLLSELKTDPAIGRTDQQAAELLKRDGPNQLVDRGVKRPLYIFVAQFSSGVVIALLVAVVISAVIGEVKSAVSIGAIVLLNAVLGFLQENRAERALVALKKLAVPNAHVLRSGHIRSIPAREIVTGDVVLIEAGGMVAADGRLIESINLQTQEAALTGESTPVDKMDSSLGDADKPLADRSNMVYAGTAVVSGRARMLVTNVGMSTEIGRVLSMLDRIPLEPTPLQRRLNQVGSRLALAALAIVAVIFSFGVWRGEELLLMFLTAVSLGVAAIPEGLPAIITINLALGAQRMLKRNALVRNLAAVETLGSITVICTDKTGTLTENRMSLAVIDVAGDEIDTATRSPGDRLNNPDANLLLTGSALCNDAILQDDHFIGEPTEVALLRCATSVRLSKPDLEKSMPRVGEFSFTSERKRMTTVHRIEDPKYHWLGSRVIFMKGAVDTLLNRSTQVSVDCKPEPLTDAWRQRIQASQNNLAQRGMRVLGVAFRSLNDDALLEKPLDPSAVEADLTFVGLIGLIDPLRSEVKAAVQTCLAAGIRPIMITGDHPLTALAVFKELGFQDPVMLTGRELDKLPVEELAQRVDRVSVYARVSPENKLNIVQALRDRGHVVAMTGDGANDAPALKKAHIGVAMGIAGTDITKQASDIILLDDNFATIVAAVKEGRVIYENIRKSLRYLLTGNIGELTLMFFAPLLGMPLPLLPVQILWMNFVTDGLPALALTAEPASLRVMTRPPINPAETIFARGLGGQILRFGVLVGFVPLTVGIWSWKLRSPASQTMIFTTLIFVHVLMVFAFRSQHDSFFQHFRSNMLLVVAVVSSMLLQITTIYVPLFQHLFGTVALSAGELAICLLLGTSVFWFAEAEKWIKRRKL